MVPSEVVDFYSPSLGNRKLVVIFETVYANGREPISSFIVCPGIKIMDTWIHDNLTRDEGLPVTQMKKLSWNTWTT